MKFMSVICVLMVIGNEHINGACTVLSDAAIKTLFELSKTMLRVGKTEEVILVLDPYEFSYEDLQLIYGVFSATANISSGKLIGLDSCLLPKLNFSKAEISVELDLFCPSLRLEAEQYDLDGAIYDVVPILGNGKLDIEMHEFSFWAKVFLKQSNEGKAILIDRIENADFTLSKIVSVTEFDGNIDEIFNAMVEDLLASHLNRFSKYLVSTYSEKIIEKLNPILEMFDTWGLLSPFLG